MKSYLYILQGKDILPVDILTWGKWFQTADRLIARDGQNGVLVSTVFLGINHQFNLDLPPLVFETMIFGGLLDSYQERYSTYDEALKGHQKVVEKAGIINVLESEFVK